MSLKQISGWFFFLLAFSGVADIVVLRNGREYKGELIAADEHEVVFLAEEGETTFPRAEVVHIRLQRRRRWSEFSRAADIPDPVLRDSLARTVEPGAFPGAGAYSLHRSVTIELRTAHTWRRRERLVARVLNEHGEYASLRQGAYRTDAEQLEVVHGLAVRPDGHVVHLRDTAIQSESPYGAHPRYDRVQRVRIALPEGKPGTVLDSEIETVRHTPLPRQNYYEEFLLAGTEPAAEIKVSLWVPDGLAVAWHIINDGEGIVAYEEHPRAEGVWHHWTRRDAPLTTGEPMMPPWSDVLPRLVVAAEPETSWTAVAAGSEIQGRRMAELAPPCPEPNLSPAELSEYLSRTVGNADIGLDATGRLPGDLTAAWNHRLASDLDRAALLTGWLRQMGHGANLVWLRPQNQGEPVAKLPSLGAFTLPAVHLPGEHPAFFIPGDELSRAVEKAAEFGGAACLLPDIGLASLPIPPADAFGTKRDVSLVLDGNGDAKVVDSLVFKGAEGRRLRAWRKLTRREVDRQVENLVAGLLPGAVNIRYEVLGDLRKNEATTGLRMTYDAPAFADSRRTLTSAKMPWLEYNAWGVGRLERTFPLAWGQPRRDTVRVAVTPAPGWRAAAIPQTLVKSLPGIAFSTTGETENRRSVCTLDYTRTAVRAPAGLYPEFKELAEARADFGARHWVWERTPHAR